MRPSSTNLAAFKAIDRAIQNSQPVFMLAWLGSAVALLAATVLGFLVLSGLDRALLIGALLTYIIGVQVVTAMINVPLNNRLQATDIVSLSEEGVEEVREAFEPRWLRWNAIRTRSAIISVSLQLVVLMRI